MSSQNRSGIGLQYLNQYSFVPEKPSVVYSKPIKEEVDYKQRSYQFAKQVVELDEKNEKMEAFLKEKGLWKEFLAKQENICPECGEHCNGKWIPAVMFSYGSPEPAEYICEEKLYPVPY